METENKTAVLPDEKSNGNKNKPLQTLFDFVETCVFAAVIAILVLFFVAKTGAVVGESMMSTMHPGDRYILTDLFYSPTQGDIIVFAPEDKYISHSNGKLWVKRIIATEGQTVEIKDGGVYVNGEKLDETYLSSDTVTLPKVAENPYTVPEGYIFVMGDNREKSMDSRYIGAVDTRRIVGKVIFRFWPFDSIGTVK